MRGYLGREQPFSAQVGWTRFRLSGVDVGMDDADSDFVREDVEFTGLSGSLNWRLNVGSRSTLELSAERRPLPTGAPTYYILNEIRLKFDRSWLRFSRVGIELLNQRNRYGSVRSSDRRPDEPEVRKDERWRIEGSIDWLIHDKLGLRVAVNHDRRSSNNANSTFSATTPTR